MSVCRVPRFAIVALVMASAACDRELPGGEFARAKVIERLDEQIGGELSYARPGDFLLENDKFKIGILSGRNSMGPSTFGGTLVDADLQWGDARTNSGNGRDQWNEMFALSSMNIPGANDLIEGQPTVFVQSEGSADSDAVVRVQGPGIPFLSLLDLLWGLVGMPDMWMTTDYIASPGSPWLTVKTTVTFDPATDVATAVDVDYPLGGLPVIGVGLETGVVLGDFWLAGGSLDVFAPGIGFDEDGAVAEVFAAGGNPFVDPFEFPFVGATGDGISYGIVPKAGNAYVPLFTSSQTAIVGGLVNGDPDGPCPNGSVGRFCTDDAFVYERYFLIGHGDIGSLVDQYLDIRGLPYGTISGKVLEQGTGLPVSGADVFLFEPGAKGPFSQWRTDGRPDDTMEDGSFEGRVPVGDWELLVHRIGRPDGPRIPITVDEGDELVVRLESPRAGVLSFVVRDETGSRLPAKVTVFRTDGDGPTRQPLLGDGLIGGDPQWVVFADDGEGEVPLPPGEYYAVASRGMEYEIDVSDAFVVDAQRGQFLELNIERSTLTEGWISADFHVHSAPSHDSGVSLQTRVRTMACEGVEFFAGTDHDSITDFAPVVESLGLEEWVQTAVGVETTTIEVGHFLAFPLQQDFLGDVGGAMDWTGMGPLEIITNLREQGRAAGYEPMVFVAHPRDGILGYFDQYGLDPFQGMPGTPDEPGQVLINASLAGLPNPQPQLRNELFTLDYDAMEMFTGKRLDTHRTATVPELAAFLAGEEDRVYPWIERTLAEQQALTEGVFRLNEELEGVIDDWFTLLNLGHRITAIGNSDTHDTTSIEAGCPRNFVMSEADDPAYISDQDVADAVREHRVVASYGPFVRMWIDGADIGSEIPAEGEIEIQIEVQAPSWIDVDRVELYENGTLIREYEVPVGGPPSQRFFTTERLTPTKDSWYVVIAMGDGSMAPVFTEVEIPAVPLDQVVQGALGSIAIVGAVLGDPIGWPQVYPIHPYALTNPIWVDVDGGGWQPPGRPAWLLPGALPE